MAEATTTKEADAAATTTEDAVIGGGKFVGIGIFLFTSLGLCVVYPYSTIISATDWFEYIMPYYANIAGVLANMFFVASVITTFLILAFASPKEVHNTAGENPKATPIRRQSYIYEAFTKGVKSALELHTRIYIGLVIEAVALFIFAIIYPTPGGAAALSFIAGVGDATAQSGIWPLAGGIHPRCSAAAALGCGITGLAAGLLRLMTKAVFGEETPEQERLGASVYFGISVVVMAGVCLVHYAIKKYKSELTVAFFNAGYAESTDSFVLRSVAIKRSLMQVNRSMMEEEGRAAEAVEGGDECPNEEEKEEDHNNNNPVEGENFQDNNPVQVEPSFHFENGEQENKGGGGSKGHIFSLCMEGTEVYREAFRCAWIPIMSQFANFFITLSLFPGVVLSMQSSSLGSWFPVILVTVFNAGDMLGRMFSPSEKVAHWLVTPVGEKILSKSGVHLGNRRPKMKYTIVLPLYCQLAFYPLFIFCVNPLYIASNVVQIVLLLIFSAISGWIYTCCYMLGPELCKELRHKEATSLLLIVSTLLALGIGSSVGLAITKALTAGL